MPEYQAHLFGGPRDSEIIHLTCFMDYISFPMITQEDLDSILIPHPEPDTPVSYSIAEYRFYREIRGGVLLFQYLGD